MQSTSSPIRYVLYLFVLSAFIFQSCDEFDQIDGNGLITVEERTNEPFHSIEIDGTLKVVLIADTAYSVRVETDENIQDIVDIENNMGNLQVKIGESANFDATLLTVYIHGSNFKSLSLNGVLDVEGRGTFRQSSLAISKKGVGTLDIHIEVEKLTFEAKDVGSTYFEGIAETSVIKLEGEGSFHSYGLLCRETTISALGIGFAEIHVSERLQAKLKGIGNVYCAGNPKFIQQEASGIGMLILK